MFNSILLGGRRLASKQVRYYNQALPDKDGKADLVKNVIKNVAPKNDPVNEGHQITSNMGLPLAVGLSLGLGVGILAQSNLVNKFFPDEPKQERVIYQTDPKVVEEIINSNRKINVLENQLQNLREDLRERNQQLSQVQTTTTKSNVDIFELSQVLEANNLANASTRKRELEEQRKSLIREHLMKTEGEILKVENKYRPVLNKIKELESHLESISQNQGRETPARILYISCQAILDRLRFYPQGPLEKDPAYEILKKYAANQNQLAITVLDSIPARALKQGIESEESLIDRFSKVERVCKRVAMIDERGGGLGRYLMSYLQSLFIIDTIKISDDEIEGRQLIDPTKWSTFDILARVRYCLNSHNLDLATRYANQLRGQARAVARDWIRDARIHLEVKQAISALSAYAESIPVESVRQSFVDN